MRSSRSDRTPEQIQQSAQFLKQADNLIRVEDFKEAEIAVEKAREVDPSNPYIEAYEERLKHILSKQREQKEKSSARGGTHVESAKKLVQEGNFDLAMQELTEAFILDPMNESLLRFETSHIQSLLDHQKKHPFVQKSAEEKKRFLGKYVVLPDSKAMANVAA
jgi:tetratricopeptide (TPR) repeat protein